MHVVCFKKNTCNRSVLFLYFHNGHDADQTGIYADQRRYDRFSGARCKKISSAEPGDFGGCNSILFQRDIRLLYDKDVSHVEYAAARDHYGKYLISPDYINAGVLLLNMKNIRRTGLFMKARKLLQTKKLIFADQSAIIRSTRAKMLLPQKFNDQKFLHKHTVVRHFSRRLFYLPYPHTDNIKQWEVERVHTVFHYHAFDDILKEYLYLKHIYEKRKHI